VNKAYLHVEAVWDDPDMIEIYVAVTNGSFSGATNVYVALGELTVPQVGFGGSLWTRRMSERSPGLVRGSIRTRVCGSLVSITRRCRPHSPDGRSGVGRHDRGAPGKRVSLVLPVEAAAIAHFVDQLSVIEQMKRGVARLEGAAA
jgi:hypothetical protein